MFIDLKNFINTQEFTFFTDYKLGRAKITASLMSKGIEYKLMMEEKKEFIFEDI